jgi:hypothetical protein
MIVAGLAAVALWAWFHDPRATRFAVRGTSVCLAIGFLGYLYVRCLTKAVRGNLPQYRIVDLFALCAAIGLLGATGFAGDGLTIGFLIVYTMFCGRFWSRLVGRWTNNKLATFIWTSASIISSFVFVLTLVSILVVVLEPRAFAAFPTIYWALASSFYVAFEHILHDDLQTGAQLFLYGLPFGLPVNVVVGLFAGAALGLVAFAWSKSAPKEM